MSSANSTHINTSLFQSNPAVSKIAIVAKIIQPVIIPPLITNYRQILNGRRPYR